MCIFCEYSSCLRGRGRGGGGMKFYYVCGGFCGLSFLLRSTHRLSRSVTVSFRIRSRRFSRTTSGFYKSRDSAFPATEDSKRKGFERKIQKGC